MRSGAEKLFTVIAEDNDLLVIDKPAGLVCHPTKGDEYSSLISRVRLYLGADSAPHMINRLDRETSGIVIVAKNLEAAVYLRKVWEGRAVEKEYFAVVHGLFPPGKVLIRAALGKDPDSAVAIKDMVVASGVSAETHAFQVRHLDYKGKALSLVRVLLLTGRKHQIRIHLAHVGFPIVGDKLYGGDEGLYLRFVHDALTGEDLNTLITANHALHAARVVIPWYGAVRTYRCSPEGWFQELAGKESPPCGGLSCNPG